jgi:hypothetical protein
MAATAQDIITDALSLLSVVDPNTPALAADLALGLTKLNDMVDSWSNESLACYAVLEQSGTLVPGQSSYTIGPGGNFNMTRPLRINGGPGTAYTQDVNGNNYGIEVVDRVRWNQIGNRSSTVTSNFPDTLFYDNQYPLGIINIDPTPNIAITMYWDSYLQLTEFANLATAMSLPPGYKQALGTNLAILLKPYYIDAPIDPVLVQLAMESKGNVKRANKRNTVSVYDSEIVSRAAVSYNPYTDRVGSANS